ncbi:MAG: hypothetical protein WD604_17565 [Balneolaceae bacterium]
MQVEIIKATRLKDLKFIAIQLLLIVTFGLASLFKWTASEIPADFIVQFGNTWLNLLPGGLFFPFYAVATLETTAFVLFIISISKTEWLAISNKIYLKLGLILTLFIFVVLSYGLRLTEQLSETANVFIYFGVVLFALYLAENESAD